MTFGAWNPISFCSSAKCEEKRKLYTFYEGALIESEEEKNEMTLIFIAIPFMKWKKKKEPHLLLLGGTIFWFVFFFYRKFMLYNIKMRREIWHQEEGQYIKNISERISNDINGLKWLMNKWFSPIFLFTALSMSTHTSTCDFMGHSTENRTNVSNIYFINFVNFSFV